MDKLPGHEGVERRARGLAGTEMFDLAEVIAMSAQRAFGLARERDLALLHDYRGITPRVFGGLQRIDRMTDHMLAWAIGSARRGRVSFEVVARQVGANRCLVTLRVADVDLGVHAAGAEDDMRPTATSARSMSLLTLAATLCGGAGGHFYVRHLRHGGTLACAQLALECAAVASQGQRACGDPAEAWLIGKPAHLLESLARRMRRFGWSSRLFETADEVAEELACHGGQEAPACVLGAHPLGVGIDQIDALRRVLPDATVVSVLVDRSHPPRRAPCGRSEVHSMPLAESVLARLAQRAPQAGRLRREAVPQVSTTHRASVLVVDDDPTNRLVMTQLLQVLGFESRTASDGLVAIDRCLVQCPDVVLMDVRMPRMDGLTATRKLRQLQRDGLLRRCPVVGSTGEHGSGTEGACIEAGMDAVITKPVDLAALERTLSRVLCEQQAA